MSKEVFLNSLDENTRKFVEYLLDEAYSSGYTDGLATESYNNFC